MTYSIFCFSAVKGCEEVTFGTLRLSIKTFCKWRLCDFTHSFIYKSQLRIISFLQIIFNKKFGQMTQICFQNLTRKSTLKVCSLYKPPRLAQLLIRIFFYPYCKLRQAWLAVFFLKNSLLSRSKYAANISASFKQADRENFRRPFFMLTGG